MQPIPTYQALIKPIEEGVRRHGPTPKGVWLDKRNSEENGVRRFDAMFDMMSGAQDFDLLDLGCGPGLALGYIESRGWKSRLRYHGIDVSGLMIKLAEQEWPSVRFEQRDIITDPLPDAAYDYTIVNGVCTARFAKSHHEMEQFVRTLLAAAWRSTRRGLAFNVMSIHVDWQRDDLFHWPIDTAVDFCKNHLSRHVVVRADYGLYEYTTQVYRAPRPLSGPTPARWVRVPLVRTD
jgi:SAM-dependent methyltransferase